MHLAVAFGTDANRDAAGRMTTVELVARSEKGERLLSAAHIGSPADLQAATREGRLSFVDVPTQAPLELRIAVRSGDGSVLCSYTRSYVLHFPERQRTAQIGTPRAVEESGYLGDFVVDSVGDITRRLR
ncbi:MAG TPA: hypothetical protein VIW45_00110 [Vicinamibacterales bacterium]|jgi:hypothetical protein